MTTAVRITRRRALLIAGGTLMTGMLACGTLAQRSIQPVAVNYGAAHCGAAAAEKPAWFAQEDTMNKILVVYASRYGSTAEVAQAIGTKLCARGITVDVQHVSDVADLAAYDAVVIGSAIRMGRWLPAALDFVDAHRAALHQMPVAIFTVHMLALDESETSRQQRATYVAPVYERITPQAEAFFAGKLDPAGMGLLDRLITKMMKGEATDQRNWQTIDAWADHLFTQPVAA